MKNVVPIVLIIIFGCILAAGCVGQIKQPTNETQTTKTVTPTNTFVPFINETNSSIIPTVSETMGSGLKGPLRVSIGGWDADLPVYVDNTSVGIVKKDKPLDLMVEEGNHTVKVCTGLMCEEENVVIKFARQTTVNFEQRLITDVEFPKPTARIVGFYPSSGQASITVEFINPSDKDLAMSAVVKLGYTYIESDSHNRVGSLAQRVVSTDVTSGSRSMEDVNLYLASGYSYDYSIPLIASVTYR